MKEMEGGGERGELKVWEDETVRRKEGRERSRRGRGKRRGRGCGRSEWGGGKRAGNGKRGYRGTGFRGMR